MVLKLFISVGEQALFVHRANVCWGCSWLVVCGSCQLRRAQRGQMDPIPFAEPLLEMSIIMPDKHDSTWIPNCVIEDTELFLYFLDFEKWFFWHLVAHSFFAQFFVWLPAVLAWFLRSIPHCPGISSHTSVPKFLHKVRTVQNFSMENSVFAEYKFLTSPTYWPFCVSHDVYWLSVVLGKKKKCWMGHFTMESVTSIFAPLSL